MKKNEICAFKGVNLGGGVLSILDTILNEKENVRHAPSELTSHESSGTTYCVVLNLKQLMSMPCQ
jgi:hypothetical protein